MMMMNFADVNDENAEMERFPSFTDFSSPTIVERMEYNPLSTALATPLSHGYKRTRDDLHDPPTSIWPKKRSKTSAGSASSSATSANSSANNHSGETSAPSVKNALMLLHELKPSVEYKLVSQTGPSHRPIFTMAVEVNGQVFEGMAQTKKEAKQAAAEKALRSFSDLPFPLPDENTHHSESNATTNADPDAATNLSCSVTDNDDGTLPTSSVSPPLNEPREIQSGYSPLYLLNQLKRDAQFEEINDESLLTNITDVTMREFKFALTIDGQRFFGSGRSKKIAKTRAAQAALEKLFGMCFDKEGGVPIDTDALPNDLPYTRRDLADRIAQCIQEKFQQLTQNDVRLQRRKVLAGIVMTKDFDLESMEAICVTTGTKCIGGDRLTLTGQALNDCHAEILARRCLIRYCYQQLQLIIDDENALSIFEKIPDTHRYQLKSSIAFHLYISTSPCGDGRLFAVQESESASSNTADALGKQLGHPLRKSRGLLRTKMEAGEGTIPVTARTLYQSMQTWDGIMGGERLLTMSCSDKLCRWNFIGLQGALLSALIEPIYLTSIIIGSLYHSEHIRRALFGRIEHVTVDIPGPYGLRRPFISGVTSPEMRTTCRAPNHALIWNCVDQKSEVIDTSTGLSPTRESSAIAKAALFQQWLGLARKMELENPPTIYCDAKHWAKDYQTAKVEVNKAFQKSGFGLWIIKPYEQDEFDLSFCAETTSSIPSTDD